MAHNEDPQREAADQPYESAAQSAGRRGTDDRRGEVSPAEGPAPTSPPPDEEAIRKGEETLERVKPY